MTTKNKLGGALINYGDTLPATGTCPDGALFVKTGAAEGLYIYRLISDLTPGTIGNQSGAGWTMLVSTAEGIDADTLNGLPASAFQPVSTELTGLSGLATQGLMVRTGAGGYVTRQLTAASSRISINNGAAGDGVASNIQLDVNEAQLQLNSIGSSIPLLLSKGGTGSSALNINGGVVYSNGSNLVALAGSSGQVLLSGGAGAPSWVNTSSLSVGNATQADSATTATTAASATFATSAGSVAWSGITGLPGGLQDFTNVPSSGFSIRSRPSNFYVFPTGSSSLTPPDFQQASISGYDAYGSTDIPGFSVGLTVCGGAGGGGRSAQLNFVWNFEENTPAGGLSYRVNDDTNDTSAWGPWRTVWDQGNLTSLSQLTNDASFVTSSALGAYVLKAGDTMTGNLVIQSPNTLPLTLRGAAASPASIILQSNTTSGTAYWFTAKADGTLHIGGAGATEPSGTIVVSGSAVTFAGSISALGNVTAFAPSDARLKDNIEVIGAAVDTVKKLRGVSYTMKSTGKREVGLIAQELKEVVPEVVREGSDGFYGVQYGHLVGLLVEAIKEQQVQIEDLKHQMETLRSQ